jgi:hypothetical protein
VKAIWVARKTLREAWREPKLFGLLMLFPALLVVIYYVAFGQSQQGLSQMLRVLVINQDAGPAGAQLVAALRAEQFDGHPVLDEIGRASCRERV